MPHPRPRSVHVVASLVLAVASLALAQADDGQALVDAGRFGEAVAAYDAALAASPDDASLLALRARARVYRADHEAGLSDAEREAAYEAAVADAERATTLAPNDADANFELARALGRTAQFRGVVQSLALAGRMREALDRTLELDPNHASAWHASALWHAEVPWVAGGRTREVVPSFERAVELAPDVLGHRVAFARILLAEEAYDRAAAQLDAAAALPAETFLARRDAAAVEALRAELP